jgi:hypothetical protein
VPEERCGETDSTKTQKGFALQEAPASLALVYSPAGSGVWLPGVYVNASYDDWLKPTGFFHNLAGLITAAACWPQQHLPPPTGVGWSIPFSLSLTNQPWILGMTATQDSLGFTSNTWIWDAAAADQFSSAGISRRISPWHRHHVLLPLVCLSTCPWY